MYDKLLPILLKLLELIFEMISWNLSKIEGADKKAKESNEEFKKKSDDDAARDLVDYFNNRFKS